MGFLKRLAFFWGVVFGLATLAAGGIVALTYLFTGKFPSLKFTEGKPEVLLMTPDEVVVMVREQVDQAKEVQATGSAGGDHNDS